MLPADGHSHRRQRRGGLLDSGGPGAAWRQRCAGLPLRRPRPGRGRAPGCCQRRRSLLQHAQRGCGAAGSRLPGQRAGVCAALGCQRPAPGPPDLQVRPLPATTATLRGLRCLPPDLAHAHPPGRCCSAGIMCPPERVETRDGFELQFQARRHWETTLLCSGAALPGAVSPRLPSWAAWMDLSRRCSRCLAPAQSNYLSHFLLANALVRHHQQQRRRRKGRGGGPLRVLFLTSMTHFGADLASDLSDVPYCRNQKWHSFQAYANSKMCTLLAAKHMDSLFARWGRRGGSWRQRRWCDGSFVLHRCGLVRGRSCSPPVLSHATTRSTPPPRAAGMRGRTLPAVRRAGAMRRWRSTQAWSTPSWRAATSSRLRPACCARSPTPSSTTSSALTCCGGGELR